MKSGNHTAFKGVDLEDNVFAVICTNAQDQTKIVLDTSAVDPPGAIYLLADFVCHLSLILEMERSDILTALIAAVAMTEDKNLSHEMVNVSDKEN